MPLSAGLADRALMKLLHIVTSDPLRTPTVVSWNEPNAWVQTVADTGAVSINPAFAWMHGGIQPEIAQTWLGFVGLGVKKGGIDDKTWTDHTDVRPTILALVGLEDDYTHDGRVVVEQLRRSALPWPIKANPDAYQRLATAYKQLNAPFGDLSVASIKFSTANIKSTSPDAYANYLSKMARFTERRDALAAWIRTVLDGAAFDEDPVNPGVAAFLAAEANLLVTQMKVMGAAAH